ncbi:hypothetical protein U1Q18_034567 [Sarracenia purpurea var. burkii]
MSAQRKGARCLACRGSRCSARTPPCSAPRSRWIGRSDPLNPRIWHSDFMSVGPSDLHSGSLNLLSQSPIPSSLSPRSGDFGTPRAPTVWAVWIRFGLPHKFRHGGDRMGVAGGAFEMREVADLWHRGRCN